MSAWHPREAETRPLPPCPCLAPSPPPVTGRRWLRTSPSKRKVRARISGRVRTRPGRIRPSFHKKRPHRLRLSQQHLRFTPHTQTSRHGRRLAFVAFDRCAPSSPRERSGRRKARPLPRSRPKVVEWGFFGRAVRVEVFAKAVRPLELRVYGAIPIGKY